MSDTRSRFEHDAAGDADEHNQAGLAIRRHHDRCFHAVEEIVPGGYIVQGIFIDEDDVAQVRKDGEGDGRGACDASRRIL